MKIFHVYEPDHFEGLIKNNLLNEDSGLKVQHIFTLPNTKKFNKLAAKGSPLYELIQKERYPLYIDRLTGGVKYHPYSFDKELFKVYQTLLGEWFLGAQLHEIGYQTMHTRIQIALARGMAKAYGKKWGVYYECWKEAENGGTPPRQRGHAPLDPLRGRARTVPHPL